MPDVKEKDLKRAYEEDKNSFKSSIYREPTPPRTVTPRALPCGKVKQIVKDGKEVQDVSKIDMSTDVEG